MILLWIFLIPLIGGAAAWFAGRRFPGLSLWVAPSALCATLLLLVSLWGRNAGQPGDAWIMEWSAPWIPQIGMSFAFAMDGLALVMSILTGFLGLIALFIMRDDSDGRTGLRRFLVMSTLASLLGVFLASDLMLFFVFYEIMLVPVFGLLLLGEHPGRVRAAMRFFIFTQAGGLLMLVAILVLYVIHGQSTGVYTFAYRELLHTPLSPAASVFVFLGFFLAFAVKLPLVPFHTWQADAYEAAPPETSILLAGLMAKAAGYGLLRFAVPLAPEAAAQLAPYAILLGVITIVYGAWMAYGQTDLKRIIAYSSASHLGYVALGVFSMSELAQRGAVMQMFCHGISVAGLFLLVELIERNAKTRNIEQLGGLWHAAPRTGAVAMVFTMATLGLPGLGNFVGEFMILLGTFTVAPVAAGIAAIGAVLAAAYALRILQRVFFGPKPADVPPWDLSSSQAALCAAMIVLLVWLGAYPQPFLEAATQAGAEMPAYSVPVTPAAASPADIQSGELR